jgi:hypothetical protein
MATRRSPAPEGWEVTGNHDGHRLMHPGQPITRGYDAQKGSVFRFILRSIRTNLDHRNTEHSLY